MGLLLLALLFGVGALALVTGLRGPNPVRGNQALSDARADAQRWYERLGGQLMTLQSDEPAARQALADAAERYHAAGGQLDRADSIVQFALARETALEGLAYVRAARTAMGLEPGPEIPAPAMTAEAGTVEGNHSVVIQGRTYQAGPYATEQTPYYYPGDRQVPAGWYSTPWWKTALGAGAGALGGMMIFDALFGHRGPGPF
ncbi:hypothetical protein KOI35_36360 [Actinoplanes bogorensis]|uniref:DUF1542 domain-containing protein n=1 Tax=Paractinoplanes bogorensis TaxID=1610840 RepID=A0ABS5Z3J5_9ACTN|nr:hypothetical protein [Actinoplanes bogorensis]MBU2669000.1 hypothetical protein [Actinoplanes bogorensis]